MTFSQSEAMSFSEVAVLGSEGSQLGYGPGWVVKPDCSRNGINFPRPSGVPKVPGTKRMSGRAELDMVHNRV